jgi:hypothetical protein
MAISHELSSEIATALLTAKERTPRELRDLKEMLLQIHSTLEEMQRQPGHDDDDFWKRSQQRRSPAG